MADAHATAHDNAIHEGDIGLGIAVDQMVEGIFFGEEVFQLGIARQGGLVEKTDVAAGTKSAERPGLAGAANRHRLHPVVITPGQQALCEGANHRKRQRVERLGPVQRDQADMAVNLAQDVRRVVR